jgi:hypothetical protein
MSVKIRFISRGEISNHLYIILNLRTHVTQNQASA